MIDLWLDKYEKVGLKAPGIILKEQASLLGEKNNHQVEASVSQSTVWIQNAEKLMYQLLLTTPALPNYTYSHFTIIHHGVDLYPVVFRIDEDVERELKDKLGKWDGLLTTRSEEQFMSALRGIFNSWGTRRVIYSLLAQNNGHNLLQG